MPANLILQYKMKLLKDPAYIENDTLNTIYSRRAVRKYQNRPVDKSILEKIIDAGRMAPSAINVQPWKFYVIHNRGLILLCAKAILQVTAKEFLKGGPLKVLKESIHLLKFTHGIRFIKAEDPVFHGAPAVIFITSPKESEWAALDIGMCAQNIMLAAKSVGLESCPIGMAKYIEHTDLKAKLKISPSEQVQLAIAVGYGDDTPEIHKRKMKNVRFIETF